MTFQELKTKLLDEGLLVRRDKEEEYCAKTGLKFENIADNCRLFSIHKPDTERNSHAVSFNFGSGSITDPKGKQGISHLMEHLLVTEEWRRSLQIHSADNEAYTSHTKMVFETRGLFDRKYPEFGLLPPLEKLFASLQNGGDTKNESRLISEKEIVLSEIHRSETEFQRDSMRLLNNYIFDKNNMDNIITLGSQESVSKITTPDLVDHFNTTIGRNNTNISVYAEGPVDNREIVVAKVKESLVKMPECKVPDVDQNDPKYNASSYKEEDQLVELPSKLASKRVLLMGIQKLTIPTLTLASRHYAELLSHYQLIFHQLCRDNGISYIDQIYSITHMPETKYLVYLVMLDKDNWREMVPAFRKTILQLFEMIEKEGDLIKSTLDLEKINQEISKLKKSNILQSAVNSYYEFGYLVDEIKYRQNYLEISLKDLMDMNERLRATHVNFYAVGDL